MSFHQFKDLGDDIWLYEPRDFEEGHDDNDPLYHAQQARTDEKGHPPALIVLCTWLGGATAKRIEKYTQGYHHLWPRSRILLIRTTLSEYLVRSTKSLRRKLRPAYREIRRLGMEGQHQKDLTSDPEDGQVILHIFSQGGGNTATQLLESTNAMLATLGQKKPLPLKQIVLDSFPGDPGIHSTFSAGARSLPENNILRPLGTAVLFILAVGLVGMEATGLKTPLAKIMRSQLNDPGVFSARASRLYLTSKADTIVDSRNVEQHRTEAVAKGLTADILRFQQAGHCSLVLEDDTAYWGAIASVWDKGATTSNAQSTAGCEFGGMPQSTSTSTKASSWVRSRL